MPDASPNSNTARRSRAAKLALFGAGGAKACAMLFTLAQVPIALSYLGTEGYGLWIALMSAFGILNFVDFGLGVGMQQQMTAAFARDDLDAVRRTFATGVRSLLVAGGACVLVALPVAWLCPWGDWLRVSDPILRAETPAALSLVVLAFFAGLAGNGVAHLANATQQSWRQALWNVAGNGGALFVVWLAARQRWGFLPFVATCALLPTVQNVALWLQLRRIFNWRGASPGGLPRDELLRMLRSSATFAVPQSAMALLGWAPALVISVGAGAAAVTAFNLLQRLYSPLAHGHAVVLAPLWPMFAEARLRGDRGWVEQAHARTLRATFLCTAGMALLALVCRPLLQLWLGADAPLPESALIWVAAIWFTLQVWQRYFSFVLLGAGQLPALATHTGAGFVVAAIGLCLGNLFGSATWVLGLGSLGFALAGLPGLWRAAFKSEAHAVAPRL